MPMTTSANGVAFLERHEGVVLRAYRCPAGVWTIGAGLTAASGVVKPAAGMVITRDRASALLAEALALNYEPAVRAAMPSAEQREFDAGVSFHFNTGAIRTASWVDAWRRCDWLEAERRLDMWNKGGGKVLPGLVRRRNEEWDLLRFGRYGDSPAEAVEAPGNARIMLPLSLEELDDLREGLIALGYAAGPNPAAIDRGAVQAFQRDHGLTVDGIVGPATMATIRRMLDARDKPVEAGATVVVGGVASGMAAESLPEDLPLDGLEALAPGLVAILRALWIGWQYRDAIAAAVQARMPRLADYLRSV